MDETGFSTDTVATPLQEGDGGALFSGILYPHRSLSPSGFVVLMSLIGLFCFITGLIFFLVGAWPVIGFLGIDVALIYFAFRLNYKRANMYETIELNEDSLIVRRIGPGKYFKEWTFQPYWLKIEIEEMPHHKNALRLSSHGRSLVIGSFLGLEERRDLAHALESALRKARAAPSG